MTTSAAAFLHHCWLNSPSRPKKTPHSLLSLIAKRNLQCWLLNEEGAQRAASNRLMSSFLLTFSPENARHDHLFRKRGCTGLDGFLYFLTSGFNVLISDALLLIFFTFLS